MDSIPIPAMMMDPTVSMSHSHRATLHQINEKLEDLRLKLNEPANKLTSRAILLLVAELQPLYKKLILFDLEGAIQRQVETFMWNDCFKTPLSHFQRHDKALFHLMIEAGVGFYLGFIHDVGMHFDISFIKNTQKSMYCTAPAIKTVLQSCPSKSSVYYFIQNSFIHVGDLLRYRGSLMEALKMYDKSTSLCPSNGHPFNQMGLAQIMLDNKTLDGILTAIYYYTRAVTVTNPFVTAQHNLDGLLARIKTLTPQSKTEEFTHSFLLAIGSSQPSALQSSSSPSFVSMLSPLVTNNSMNTNQLFRIIVIALWAWRRESNKSLLAVDASSENVVLEIIAAIINSLLIAGNAYPDLTNFYALAHLKLLMDWLRVNSSLLNNAAFRTKLHTGTLCKFFNQLLILENNICGLKSKDIENIILPEEKRLRGFLPFCRAYDSLSSVMEETDSRIQWIRIYRTLKCADGLSESRLSFIERYGATGLFSEVPFGSQGHSSTYAQVHNAIRPPNRRNVALQSIFNQLGAGADEPYREMSSPVTATSPFDSEPGLPVSSKTSTINAVLPLNLSSFSPAVGFHKSPNNENHYETKDDVYMDEAVENRPPFGYIGNGASSISSDSEHSSVPTQQQEVPNPFLPLPRNDVNRPLDVDSTDFSSLFCSIWTPRQTDTSKTNTDADGWTS